MAQLAPYGFWKLLIPFSWLFALVIWVRNFLYDQGIFTSTSFPIPIISVGNITVGGTGKTPHVEYLSSLLGKEYRTATLSRGYGRKTRNYREAGLHSTAREVGDEPLQLKLRFPHLIVAVDRKRVQGIARLLEQDPPVELIILDDAFQHRAVKAGFSILLIDFSKPLQGDMLLPAGRLREPARNRERAQMILVTRTPPDTPPIQLREYVNSMGLGMGQHLYFTTMRTGEPLPLFSEDAVSFKPDALLVVCGIANPKTLLEYANTLTSEVESLVYPDHHWFSEKDISRISQKFRDLKTRFDSVMILTTEKDSMRLKGNSLEHEIRGALYTVRLYVEFLNDDKEAFDQQLKRYVSDNKRSSLLHQDTNRAHT